MKMRSFDSPPMWGSLRACPELVEGTPCAHAQGGFTLIEMLAALAVLAIAMSAILSGMARYADNAGYLRQKTVALWVAHNRLSEIELAEAWPDVGKSDGDVEMAGVKWRWQAEVKKTSDDHLRRVDVRVLAPGSKEQYAAQLSGFLADTGRK